MKRVWVVDDDDSVRYVLERALEQAEFEVCGFSSGEAMLRALNGDTDTTPDAVITDLRMPGIDGFELVERLTKHHPHLPVLMMTAYGDLDNAVAAYQKGVFEYLPKPFDVDEVIAVTRRACASDSADTVPTELPTMRGMIGESPAMQQVFRSIGRLSRSELSVLITGETGVGKELVARALHQHSPRSQKPFIALNTAAIPTELLESELFGHERGAFTGANERRVGRFEQAHEGTLFLDEIGDMPAALQTRLLRVLAEGEFYRVGGRSLIQVDVRVIAATHVDLEQRVAQGRFREDLMHRLNVIAIHVPPLRERSEDIQALAEHFLAQAADEAGTECKRLDDDAARRLGTFSWPGNVRQLKNLCRRLTVMTPGENVHAADLPEVFGGGNDRGQPATGLKASLRTWAEEQIGLGHLDLAGRAVDEVERELMQLALEHTAGHRQKAAKLLGWGRNTLTRKLKEQGD